MKTPNTSEQSTTDNNGSIVAGDVAVSRWCPSARQTTRFMTTAMLVAPLAFATGLVAQAPARDRSGTWVLDVHSSDFGGAPAPTSDSLVITRSGQMYQVDQYANNGGTMQHVTSQWPIGDGQVTNEIPEQTASMRSTVTMRGDTATFTGDISLQGQVVAHQTGRESLSPDGKTLTRVVDIEPLVGSSGTIHVVAVYLKKR
jgi:hypothetical protein